MITFIFIYYYSKTNFTNYKYLQNCVSKNNILMLLLFLFLLLDFLCIIFSSIFVNKCEQYVNYDNNLINDINQMNMVDMIKPVIY